MVFSWSYVTLRVRGKIYQIKVPYDILYKDSQRVLFVIPNLHIKIHNKSGIMSNY